MNPLKVLTQFTKKELSALVAGLLLAAFSGISLAQVQIESANQQVQRAKMNAKLNNPTTESVAPLSEAETDDIGPQFIVRQKPGRALFEVTFETQFSQSSNIYLTENDKVRGPVMVSALQLAIAPTPIEFGNGLLGWKGGYRHQKFNYGKFSRKEKSLNDLDFDVSSLFLQGYYFSKKNWLLSAGIEHNRLLNAATGKYDEFYSEWAPTLNFEKQFKLGEKSMLGISGAVAWHRTQVDPPDSGRNDRLDEAVMLALSHELAPNLSVQPYYRVQFAQYLPHNSRQDLTHSVGVALGYVVNKWAAIRFSAGFEGRDSSAVAVNDYRKVDTGLGLSLQAKF